MELKKINQLLKNLRSIDSKKLQFVQKDVEREINDEEGEQGEEGRYANIYKIVGEDELYLKIWYYTDSYGCNDAVEGVEFVKPKEKKVVEYESI